MLRCYYICFLILYYLLAPKKKWKLKNGPRLPTLPYILSIPRQIDQAETPSVFFVVQEFEKKNLFSIFAMIFFVLEDIIDSEICQRGIEARKHILHKWSRKWKFWIKVYV